MKPTKVFDAGLRGGVGHLLGFGRVRRERLLAIDRLAGGDGGERDRLVQRVRRGDVDEIDRGSATSALPVAGRAREAERLRRLVGDRVVDVGEKFEHRRERQIEDAGAARKAWAWLRPMKPLPMRPMRNGFFMGPGSPFGEHFLVDDERRIEPAIERGENVLGRGDGKAGRRFAGQAGNVRAEEDAIERKERVIPRRRLLVEDVEAGAADPPCPQRVGKRRARRRCRRARC